MQILFRCLIGVFLVTGASFAQSVADMVKTQGRSVVAVEAKIEVDLGALAEMMGLESDVQVQELSGTGVIVNDRGIVAVSSAVVEGSVFPEFPDGDRPEVKLASLHVISSGGKAWKAAIIGKSEKLSLTFLAIEADAKSRFTAVDLKADVELRAGQSLRAIGRLSGRYGHVAYFKRGYCAAILSKPLAGSMPIGIEELSLAVFAEDARFVGITVPSWMEKSGVKTSTFLPSERARTLVASVATLKAEISAQLPGVMKAASRPEGAHSKEEFFEYVEGKLQGVDEAFLEKFYRALDSDHDGWISTAEFEKRMNVLQALNSAEAEDEESSRGARPDEGERALDDKEGDFDSYARRAVSRDSFPVFDDPEMTPAAKASVADDEMVIGVFAAGEARAYPVSVMGRHELGNDTCGGIPIAVSW